MGSALPIVKMHGLGNSYVFVDLMEATVPQELADWPALARAVSDPGTGVGADGLILIERGVQAPVRMRIFNADGSEGEMCGNGIRCLAMYVHQTGRAPARFVVETAAGPRPVEVVESARFGRARVRVDMGAPHSTGPAGVALGQPLTLQVNPHGPLTVWPVSVGNPHAVLFVEDTAHAPVRELGPLVERHPLFPGRVNVEFVTVVGPERLRMRVWERGSGETRACGTGACASLVAAALSGRAARRATVELLGGPLEVEWTEQGRIFMVGPAELVFQGELDSGWLSRALGKEQGA